MELIKDYWFIIDTIIIPFFLWIARQYKIIKSELKQGKKNDVVIMQDLLMNNYNRCVKKGFCTQYERQHFLAMCDEYFKSNGNSFIKDLKESFLKIQTKEE